MHMQDPRHDCHVIVQLSHSKQRMPTQCKEANHLQAQMHKLIHSKQRMLMQIQNCKPLTSANAQAEPQQGNTCSCKFRKATYTNANAQAEPQQGSTHSCTCRTHSRAIFNKSCLDSLQGTAAEAHTHARFVLLMLLKLTSRKLCAGLSR
eukprot:712780-Pelagomonas_calceolata.AAC.6